MLLRKFILSGLASLGALCGTLPADANWQGAFQVTCFRRQQPAAAYYSPAPVVAQYAPPVTAHYADPCCNPCAPPAPVAVATTRYIQRTCYEPVTTYQCQKYYQNVTSYRATSYYEPVTSCRYVCAYDPCTCSYRYVAQQVTSYRLRTKYCPETTVVERSMMVPVTSYRATTYYEPQTCYTWVDPCTGQPINGGQGAVAPAGGTMQQQPAVPAVPAPSVSEQYNSQRPNVTESRSGQAGGSSPLYQPPGGSQQLPQPPGSGSSYRPPPRPAVPAPAQQRQPLQFQPRMDRVTAKPADSSWTPAKLAKHIITDDR